MAVRQSTGYYRHLDRSWPRRRKGPLAADFDFVHEDLDLKEPSWEKAERKLLEQASQLAIVNANITQDDLDYFVGGDLMNQIISNTFAARGLGVPYIGVFGACSTSMEALALGSLLVDSGNANFVMAGTCSHNCSAEKQFRYPTEYGSQKPPTAQYTVTGAGVAIVGKKATDRKLRPRPSAKLSIWASKIRSIWERRWRRRLSTRFRPI